MSNKLKKRIMKRTHNTRVKLSQCMIVKNEEENIEKALSWAKGITFEQIVVDTGSTDKTVEIAKKMGAKVYHFEWINDFAAAKNYAIEQASGDWIAFLDADEYINKKETKSLYELLVSLKNPDSNQQSANLIRLPIVSINDDGSIISTHLQHRIFRNKPGIRYEGKIHENILCENSNDNVYVNVDHIKIWHTGYKESLVQQKGKRNTPILEEIVKNNPEDYNSLSYLAEAVAAKGDPTRAITLYMNCLNYISQIAPTRKYTIFLELGKLLINENSSYEEIKKIFDQFCEYYPESPDPSYLMGCYEFKRNNDFNACEYFENSLSLLLNYQDNYKPISPDAKEEELRKFLGYAYFNIKKYEKALEHFILYQKRKKEDGEVLFRILHIICQEEISSVELLQYIKQILSALYDLTNLKDILICINACMKLGLNDLINWLKSHLNEEDRNWLEN